MAAYQQSLCHLGGAPVHAAISAFLLILALEILFLFKKPKPEIEGLTIFDHNYL